MDRVNQLRGGAGGGASDGGDATHDESAAPSEAFMSADESSSKYFSLSDSTFDITPIKDVSLASAASNEADHTMTDDLISNLSPITKKDSMLDSFKIGKQIEAANILSGGVNIFDDNDNSFDGDELVIDDNVDMEEKMSLEKEAHLDEEPEAGLVESAVDVASKDTEVVLQIDGKNVDAIDIGNGLYLYRKVGQEELAAVQIITEENQAPTFKFLKVRENAEGNLEVYEEFEVEVSKDVPSKETMSTKNTPHVPNKDVNKGAIKPTTNQNVEKIVKPTTQEISSTSKVETQSEVNEAESKTEVNFNGKMMKINESRKSPVVGSYTPMTYHSTPNKEGKPLTKTMVDQQLHPSRHSDNVKKTIEVHTDQKKQANEDTKLKLESAADKDGITQTIDKHVDKLVEVSQNSQHIKDSNIEEKILLDSVPEATVDIVVSSSVDKIDPVVEVTSETPVPALEVVSNDMLIPPEEVISPILQGVKSPEKSFPDLHKICSIPKVSNISEKSEAASSGIISEKLSSAVEVSDNSLSNDDHVEPITKQSIATEDVRKEIKQESISSTSSVDLKSKDKKEDVKRISSVTDFNDAVSSTSSDQSKNVIPVILLNECKTNNDNIVEENTATISNTELPESAKQETVDDNKTSSNVNVTLPKQIKSQVTENKATIIESEPSELTKHEKVEDIKTTSLPHGSQIQLLENKTSLLINIETDKTEDLKTICSTSELYTDSEDKNLFEEDTKQNVKINLSDSKKEPGKMVEKIESLTITSPKIESKIILPTKECIEISNTNQPKVSSNIEDDTDSKKDVNPKSIDSDVPVTPDSKQNVCQTYSVDQISKDSKPGETVNSEKEASKPMPIEKVIENKMNPTIISPINKLIQVPQGMKLKIVPKAESLNTVLKKIEPTPLMHTGVALAAKLNEPKIYSKTDKLIPVSAGIEPKIISKVEQPITKGFELKTISKTVPLNPSKSNEVKITKVSKPEAAAPKMIKNKAVVITSNQIIVPSKIDPANKNIFKVTSGSATKPINNNHAAVPFGKWTDANRQEFLNKFKEIKVPTSSTTNQIKNSNDLNRIDVLKKIDSQRSNNKAQDKSNVKDTVFTSNITQSHETKIAGKNDGIKVVPKPVELINTIPESPCVEPVSSTMTSSVDNTSPDHKEMRELNMTDLIGKAIVDMLNRPIALPMTRSPLDEPRQVRPVPESTQPQILGNDHTKAKPKVEQPKIKPDQLKPVTNAIEQIVKDKQNHDKDSNVSLDYIEMKMNELHGIPFVERPPHELPKVYKTYGKTTNQSKGAKKLLPCTSKQPVVLENVIDLESDDEVIEHEPVTGDIDQSKELASEPSKSNASGKIVPKEISKESIITENDFDKFARRNSKSFENCLSVKLDGNERTNIVQTIKEKDITQTHSVKKVTADDKSKFAPKQFIDKTAINKALPNTKFGTVPEDPNSKNYQLKIHDAYQSALTAKRKLDRPLIEDKPVKVVFMDANPEFVPNQLNVQGKDLSPAKKSTVNLANNPQPHSSEDKETTEVKQDNLKTKTKHQRKQVLTPVEAPELELIQPPDFDTSPKKKRKFDDHKTDKSPKSLVPKKSYLLGRTGPEDQHASQDANVPVKDVPKIAEVVVPDRTVSAIDSLVKAAELLDKQSIQNSIPNTESPQSTPVKRGRGRPRKYPLPDGAADSKAVSPSPQIKPRLIDAKPAKKYVISDEDSSDDEPIIRENWTMGKINENIVCPICNKLFRSENVVFKHVKHCSGVSPTRSDLEKRRRRYSKDSDIRSDSLSDDLDFEEKQKDDKKSPKDNIKVTPRKESTAKEIEEIVIEDTPLKKLKSSPDPKKDDNDENTKLKFKRDDAKNKVELSDEKQKREPTLKEIADEKLKFKQAEIKVNNEKTVETKNQPKSTEEGNTEKTKKKTIVQQSNNLTCEFCGKTFRQLSYLVNHKLQHQKEQTKKPDVKVSANPQVFSCEVCKKEFRKQYHLVQHRIIHNPEVPTRISQKSSPEQAETKMKEAPRISQKSSSEQTETKMKETPAVPKPSDDTSAGFRCEPCDKSFRKLHHLVEHRETHDGINRQKTNTQPVALPIEKPPPPPQCDVCKKYFRKLHHLIEHKELHHSNVEQMETSSEKSDDKSVQSSLSTRDIIHECSLCYMVFPNEHSLKKHFVFCQQKKKRQLKVKENPENCDIADIVDDNTITEDITDAEDEPEIVANIATETVAEVAIVDEKTNKEQVNDEKSPPPPKIPEIKTENPKIEKPKVEKPLEVPEISNKEKELIEVNNPIAKPTTNKRALPKDIKDGKKTIPEKIKKKSDKIELPKKIVPKDKISTAKKQKTVLPVPLPVLPEDAPAKSSDEDEVRYMLNPNFKEEDTNEGKVFMKVRSNKRNSLQIERPNSRELVNRRTSLQHPPKIPRLKAKPIEPKVVPTITKPIPKPKPAATEQAASTDSDDSDVRYSFPENITKVNETQTEKKAPRKSIADKRKSLSGIAKRKSLGQPNAKLKFTSPIRVIKRRTLNVEHRCDCGQLFGSAALLARHTSLAHTPPRIRRRRSPPPAPAPAPARAPAHRGVPVPDKMRKLMMRSAKKD